MGTRAGTSTPQVLPLLLVLCAVVAAVAVGFAHGFWWPNVHNGVLALSFTVVGVALLCTRPGHGEGRLFVATGALEAVMFLGRQIGRSGGSRDVWWAWVGVWPLALTVAMVTWCVLCFPEGRFLSQRWRQVGIGVLGVGGLLALASALWPVEYAAAGITLPPPFVVPGLDAAKAVWDVVAHPAYVVFQVLWVVAVLDRWRQADEFTRRQLSLMVATVAVCFVGLVAGVATGAPWSGLLLVGLLPAVAGWSIERLSLAKVIEEQTRAGRLVGLTPRENDVLELMAQGLSNAAIGARLHVSVKTVEPVVGSIFAKLGLPTDGDNNRRVLAVMRYLRHQQGPAVRPDLPE